MKQFDEEIIDEGYDEGGHFIVLENQRTGMTRVEYLPEDGEDYRENDEPKENENNKEDQDEKNRENKKQPERTNEAQGSEELGVEDEGLAEAGAGEAAEAGIEAGAAEGAGAGATGAGLAAEAAGSAAATEEAVAAGAGAAATSEFWGPVAIGCIVIVGSILLITGLIIFGFMVFDKDATYADENVPGSGDVQGFMTKACDYVKDTDAYKQAMVKEYTDCWGYVATTLINSGVDPKLNYQVFAADAPKLLGKNSSKYSVFKINSTRQLKPGDMIFSTEGKGVRSGSHAGIYTGGNFCGCGSGFNTLEASLGTHGPQCDRFKALFDTAVRIIK